MPENPKPESNWDKLSDEDKAKVDKFIEQTKAEITRQQKLEFLKGMTIRDVVMTEDGTRIRKLVCVKDCVAYEVELGYFSSVMFDGEMIG